MAIIESTVGELPYLLTDFDQHSYESEDCFTRFMPKAKLDTAVRPIVAPSGRKILLANDRIVTALENDLDQAYVPGSLVEMLKQRPPVRRPTPTASTSRCRPSTSTRTRG